MGSCMSNEKKLGDKDELTTLVDRCKLD